MTVTRPPASSGTSDAAASSRTRRRALWVVAASLTLLVAAAVGVTLGRSSTSAAPEDPVAAQAGPPAGTTTPGSEWDIPTRAPADIRWERVELPRLTTWIPDSPSYGPANNESGEWGGWSQTPMGAVMAAYSINAGWGLNNTDAAAYAADHSQTFPDYVTQSLAERPSDDLAPRVTLRPTGFRVDDYTVASAAVTVAMVGSVAGSAEAASMLTTNLQWVDGDWKVVLTPETHPRSSQPATGSFVPWGPQ